LEPDIFIYKSNLIWLSIASNYISDIHPSTFQNQSSLLTLDISGNNITIKPDTFRYNSCLQWLSLANNKITDIHYSTFQNQTELSHLDITENMITSIEPKTFFYNKNLKWFSLANNTVNTLHLVSAWNNTLLYQLDLSGNKIGLISVDMFYLNADIKCLVLNNNSITDIVSLHPGRQTQLETLILSNNQLTHLRSKLLSTHTNLLNLSLAGNYISYISDKAFYALEQLERLDLSNNNIAVLSPDVFKHLLADKLVQKFHVLKLRHLNLAGNKIRSFDLQEYFPLHRNSDTFGTSFELVSLDLSANRLDSLNTTSVNWLKQSNTLIYLGGNPWKCECSVLQEAWKELRKKLTLHCTYPKHLEGQTWNVIGNMCYDT
jgi:Leucine-rich repeat (LRR) protein